MPLGYLCLVLHAHLPFVRHPEYEDFLEEDWLYEAITETYIPLLEVFDGLERDRVDWRLTMSVTPTLAAMLSDPLLQYRYVRHLDNLIALAGKEIDRTRWEPEYHPLALMYHHRFTRAREVFTNQYCSNILRGFRRFFLVHGHGGNDELVQLAARDLALRHDAHLAAASYWNATWTALTDVGAHEQGGLPGHAGSFETALVLALRPELVVEVAFDHITGHRIRHGAKLLRWREDKEPSECHISQLRS